MNHFFKRELLAVTIFLLIPVSQSLMAQGQFTFEDVLKFEDLKTPVISANGEWVAFGVWPEIGDGEVRIKQVNGNQVYTISRGENPQISKNGIWAGAIVKPPYIEAENAGSDAPKNRALILNTSNGERVEFEAVQQFEFANDSGWVLIHHHQNEDVKDGDFGDRTIGEPVTLRQLESESSIELPFVHEATFDSTAAYFVYTTADTTGEENGLYLVDLSVDNPSAEKIKGTKNGLFSNLSWDHKRSRLVFTESVMEVENDFRAEDASVYTWSVGSGEPEVLITSDEIPEEYRLRDRNSFTWTHGGDRLFFGLMEAEMVALDEHNAVDDSLTAENVYDVDRILKDIEGKVWHWDDPLVKTHEKQQWNSRKNRLHTAVYHLNEDRWVLLTDLNMPNVRVDHNSKALLGSNSEPYSKLITWDGWYSDYYIVDPETGERSRFLEKARFGATISPNGNFAAWFDGEDWNLQSTSTGERRNITENIDVPFYDEDNDRPMPSGSYGIAGWTDNDEAVLIYDKYDIWQFDTESGEVTSITDGFGREEQRIFRIYDLDSEKETYSRNEQLLLTMYHDWDKNYGFYEGRVGRSGVNRVMEDEKNFSVVALAEQNDAILFTQETYTEYPNLWVADDRRFNNPVQVSHLHENLTEQFAWGHAELVEWLNMDGKTVQGVLIYPGDYDPDETYPVFIYYYERFSQRLYDFNKPVTNHRPNFAQYTSDGYAVFLPDVWFDIPLPGYSATKNIVPGVQKLVEMGVADPDAIGLHGHSWSGYMTAHVVTQTDIFAAAVAGAPVSNMTSAYGGIRWGSGLARQFQYEQTQSRMGVSLWENPNPYIENSPLFFADRINTPLLIQHGDADEAVPWYQSIEMYLAMRRLGKESVFLHYYDEPHHLGKLPNRLDYAIKMKEYMDHYLKGEPAPAWITDGVPYRGE